MQDLLPFFSTREACALRAVCAELRSAVAAHPWADAETPIHGSLGAWRAAFPHARAANVSRRPLDDREDWALLAGDGQLQELACCQSRGVTDQHLALLFSLRRLDARLCPNLTRQGLAALPLLEWADVRGCQQLEVEELEEGQEEQGQEVDLLQDGRFVVGDLEECSRCQAPSLQDLVPCWRGQDFYGEVTCRAEDDGAEGPLFCEACVEKEGCHKCGALECEECTDDQYEETGYHWDQRVGRNIGPCSVCHLNVCGTPFENKCGGECAVCKERLCSDCGVLVRVICAPCEKYINDHYDGASPPIEAAVCSKCRNGKGVLCAMDRGDSCLEVKRKAAARALAHHQAAVQASLARASRKRKAWFVFPF